MAAAKLTGISPRLAFYHMSQPPGDEGESTKDFEQDSTPSSFELQRRGCEEKRGWGRGRRMGRRRRQEKLNHIFQLNKRNQIKGFYL